MNIVFFQYGDYGEAYRRLIGGGVETYRDQFSSVEYVASLAQEYAVTTVAICDRPHDEMLSEGLRSIGVGVEFAYSRKIESVLDSLGADRFVCRTPNRFALGWAAKKRVLTLPVFADLFTNRTMRDRFENFRLRRILSRCNAPIVSNHSATASESLKLLGIPENRIVPWDWSKITPLPDAKVFPPENRPFTLFYAGAISEAKGVGDLIDAMSLLKGGDREYRLFIAGKADQQYWTERIRKADVSDCVTLLGLVPASDVVGLMSSHDAVVVPSRHEYAEGLPNTIFEAMASRAPLIVSDHPAFVKRVVSGTDCLVFGAGDCKSLCSAVVELSNNIELYEKVSIASGVSLEGLYVGEIWSDLVGEFLSGSAIG